MAKTLSAAGIVALGLASQGGVAEAGDILPLACGGLLDTAGMTYVVSPGDDILNCPAGGLTITAANVTLDLNGNTVSCATTVNGIATGQTIGIQFAGSASFSQVKNGEITGCATGVRIGSPYSPTAGGNNKVRNMNIHDNIGPSNSGDNGDGVAIWNSSNNLVEGNRMVRNGPYSGAAVITGDYSDMSANPPAIVVTDNKIRNNFIDNNNVSPCTAGTEEAPGRCTARDPMTGAPITMDDGTGTQVGTIMRGQVTTGSNNDGIRVEGPNATNTDVIDNVVNRSGNNGIFMQPSCKNPFGGTLPPGVPRCEGDVGSINTLIRGNTADWNGYGRAVGSGINAFAMIPVLLPPSYARIVDNKTRYNYTDGIQMSTACNSLTDALTCATSNNMLRSNTATHNGRNGITLESRTYMNTVVGNTVSDNGTRVPGSGIQVQANTPFTAMPDGTLITPDDGTGAFDNELHRNRGTGNSSGWTYEDQTYKCTIAGPPPSINNWTGNMNANLDNQQGWVGWPGYCIN